MGSRIVSVIPAYNEEKSIGQTMDALLNQTMNPEAIVVVDNGSSDATPDIVADYQSRESRVQLQHEPVKGTGRACNTGFYFAIEELGAEIVSRTDADTLPSPGWTDAIHEYFAANPHTQLIGGPNLPKKDEFFRSYDRVIHPIFWTSFRVAAAGVTRSRLPLRMVPGHNLAIRSSAFVAVGGFTNTSIDECDEDLELSRAVFDKFGYEAMGHSPDMVVHTSMRRIRRVGYRGLVGYYTHPSREKRLQKTGGGIDIR